MAKRKSSNVLDYAFDLFALSQANQEMTLETTAPIAPITQEQNPTIKVGTEVILNNHTYVVVDTNNKVSILEDQTYKSLIGVSPKQSVSNSFLLENAKVVQPTETQAPVQPTETQAPVQETIHESKTKEIKRKPRKKSPSNMSDSIFDLFQIVNNTNAQNESESESTKTSDTAAVVTKSDYTIMDNDDYRTKGERIVSNIEAITLLKSLSKENRNATPQEQAVLNRYSGWGGLQDIFDESKNNAYYHQLRELLTPEEYADASRSILDAFYTPYSVIKSIYKCLQKAGFKGGRVLEPSCGTGRFFGLMPKEIRDRSNLYGVELDGVTSAIAAQLYQNAHIRNCGFEDVNYGDNVFDLAITNVPYGDVPVADSRYNRYNFKIHDYFITKMIDVVRPGGIVIVLTSSYSMDKNSQNARKYWAKRAELVGAYRLPNSTFNNAHTNVVADILIFKKREEMANPEGTEWLENTTLTVDGTNTNINMYYINHPEKVIGSHKVVSGPFGNQVTVDGTLNDLSIIEKPGFDYEEAAVLDSMVEVLPEELMGEPDYCYCLYNNEIVYKQNGIISHIQPRNQKDNIRKRKMISLRKAIIDVINCQVTDADALALNKCQRKLEAEYDAFVKENGYVSSRANSLAFREDAKYPLLCSLEIFNDEGEFVRKADIFTQRTIKNLKVPKAENEQDALEISLAEKGCIDFGYMSSLTGLSREELIKRLQLSGRLFKVPFSNGAYEPSETYLSGYVKKKLAEAKTAAEKDSCFERNVTALEAVQPKDIPFHEIYNQLGSTWIPLDIYQQFMEEIFDLKYDKPTISIVNHSYYINYKGIKNVKTTSTYGTSDSRINGLVLLEDCLNLISKKIYDYIEDENGTEKAILNPELTQIAQNKQELLRQTWNEWVGKDLERRNRLVRVYNDQKNDLVQPEYDGSKLRFPGMSSNIELMPHQKNAVLRILRTGNTLLAHVVGAGKTFTMIAGAMERKRLGLSNKPCFVVPNHLVEQWAGEINRLYPFANVLITKKEDFKPQNRKRFCAKIATGNWDAVVMSHSQFSRIPLSQERQEYEINKEISEIERMLNEFQESSADYQTKNYTKRQYESQKKKLTAKLKNLADSKRDDTVTFEETGIDLLFLDEAHLFKNLQVYTKLQNVAGLTNAVSKKSTDLLMKIHYLNELTNYQGVVFATGTPISNAVCELYVMQKYLQERDLLNHGIYTFDSWISHFSETENKIEVKPEGTGYRSVTRVSKYHNLPELMNIFRLVADIRVADQLNLDVPERKNHNIAVEPSEVQKKIVESFAERAESIRSGDVPPEEDNMLCVTNDGRKVAIDQRLFDLALNDDKSSKLNRCTRTAYRIWMMTKDIKATQLIFCDMGTPKKNNTKFFDLYNDVKNKLISWGVPENEIAFIHDANTDQKKTVLFDKVNRGEVRILLGSTEKLGAGTNVQKRLLAIHNIDCPWRPSDLEQRAGRIVRQGNMFEKVHVYTYVTKNTFDTYLYQTVLAKAEFIAQIMSSKTVSRDMEDIDSTCLNYAEIKALSTGNPAIKEKMELEERVAKLKVLRSNYFTQKYECEVNLKVHLPNELKTTKARIFAVEQDIEVVKSYPLDEKYHFSPMTIGDTTFGLEDKQEAAELLLQKLNTEHDINTRKIAEYRGFDILAHYNIVGGYENVSLYSKTSGYTYNIVLGDNALGNIQRINNALDNLSKQREKLLKHLDDVNRNIETAKKQFDKPFEQETEYQNAIARLNEVNAKLSVEGKNGIENIVA